MEKKEADIPAVDKNLYLANMRDTILRLRGRTSLLAGAAQMKPRCRPTSGWRFKTKFCLRSIPRVHGSPAPVPNPRGPKSRARSALEALDPMNTQPLKF